MNKQPISAVIITKNEENIIQQCIESLMPFCSQVIVVDSGSTDKTVDISRNCGAEVLEIEWKGYGHARNTGIKKAKYEWVFSPDADEIADARLATQISTLSLKNNTIYKVNRLTMLNGKWIRYCNWHPDWIPRLYQKSIASWSSDSLHEHLLYTKPVNFEKLDGLLLHYSFPTIDSHIIKMEKYAKLGAQKLFNKGVKPSFYRSQLKPIIKMLKTFTIHRSFLDGSEGMYITKANYILKKKEAAYLKELWNSER